LFFENYWLFIIYSGGTAGGMGAGGLDFSDIRI
jgi:hypothetical protein